MFRRVFAFTLLMGFFTSANTSFATRVVYEDFNYTAGDLVTNSGGAWVASSGAGTNNQTVTAGSIAYGLITNQIGGKVSLANTGQDVATSLGASGLSGTGAGETIYYSAIVDLTAVGTTTGDYFMMFVEGLSATGTIFRGKLFAKLGTTGYFLGVSYSANAGATVVYDATERPFNTPVFVVVKVTSNAGTTNDNVKLFINPALDSTEPGSPNATSTDNTVADFATFGFLVMRQGAAANAASGTIDTIRVGTTWDDVATAYVPVELSTFSTE